jgi:trehalose 6-phosphate synthase
MRNSIFESLCACDLVGFQSRWDARAFLEGCEGFVAGAAVDYAGGTVTVGGHTARVRVYPTSVDVAEIRQIASSPRTQEFLQRMESVRSPHTIVRVDRTEPSKNITRGFRAYQILLQEHPELHGQVTFLAFLVASRTHIKQYERYQDEITSLVKGINAEFGRPDWQPVQVFTENNYTQAMAGLRVYDTLMVNPVVDGMNLVTKEGPVVNDRNGVLLLSEASSAYDQLQVGALGVAPADLQGTADALYQAITMSADERQRRGEALVEAIEREDVTQWLLSQMEEIADLL